MQPTYVRTHSQRSKPVSQPATRIAVRTHAEHTLARVSHSTSQPPNSQMPRVGARASGAASDESLNVWGGVGAGCCRCWSTCWTKMQ